MLDICILLVMCENIGNMARRRGRSQWLFFAMLLGGWLIGELMGWGIGSVLAPVLVHQRYQLPVTYSFALAGAAFGATLAFLFAYFLPPVGGVWRELPESAAHRSRLWGAVIGGLVGGILGGIMLGITYSGPPGYDHILSVIQGFVVTSFIGALLGMVSGVQKS